MLPSRSLTGGCLLLGGLGLMLYLFGRLENPTRWEPIWVLWLPAIAAAAVGLSWVFQPPRSTGVTASAVMPAALPGPELVSGGPDPNLQMALGSAARDLERVQQLLAAGRFPFELILTDTAYSDQGQLTRYALHALVPGYLSDQRNATMVTQRLQRAVTGDWLVELYPDADKVTVTRKKPFPAAVAPPIPARMVSSVAEATARYSEFAVGIGVDELGRRLEFDFKTYHHWLIIGPTGSGKSVLIRGLIEEIRAQGGALFIGDGKTTDYVNLVGTSNVPMVSASNAEHVRLVHAGYEELARRRKIGEERKAAGLPMDFAPWVIILDEFATMRSEIMSTFEEHPLKDKAFLADLRALLKVGREFRIQVILATQDLYAVTIPRDLLNMCRLVITFGQPSDMTLKYAFNDEMRPKARQLGQTISPEAQGRGVVAVPEAATVKEFQAYWGYSPGLDVDDPKVPDHIRSAWRAYRDTISTRVPRLYSRQWFKVQEPEDLALSMAEIHDLEMVNLDLEDGTPDPAMFQYDKQHGAYNGNLRGQMRPGALREILRHGAPPTPTPRPAVAVTPSAVALPAAVSAMAQPGDYDEPDGDPDEVDTGDEEAPPDAWGGDDDGQ